MTAMPDIDAIFKGFGENTRMLYGDAKAPVSALVGEFGK